MRNKGATRAQNALYQSCTNNSTPLIKRAAEAQDKKYFYTSSPSEPLAQIQNNFTEVFLMMQFQDKLHLLLAQCAKFKIISQNCSSTKTLDEKYLKTTSLAPLFQVKIVLLNAFY